MDARARAQIALRILANHLRLFRSELATDDYFYAQVRRRQNLLLRASRPDCKRDSRSVIAPSRSRSRPSHRSQRRARSSPATRSPSSRRLTPPATRRESGSPTPPRAETEREKPTPSTLSRTVHGAPGSSSRNSPLPLALLPLEQAARPIGAARAPCYGASLLGGLSWTGTWTPSRPEAPSGPSPAAMLLGWDAGAAPRRDRAGPPRWGRPAASLGEHMQRVTAAAAMADQTTVGDSVTDALAVLMNKKPALPGPAAAAGPTPGQPLHLPLVPGSRAGARPSALRLRGRVDLREHPHRGRSGQGRGGQLLDQGGKIAGELRHRAGREALRAGRARPPGSPSAVQARVGSTALEDACALPGLRRVCGRPRPGLLPGPIRSSAGSWT